MFTVVGFAQYVHLTNLEQCYLKNQACFPSHVQMLPTVSVSESMDGHLALAVIMPAFEAERLVKSTSDTCTFPVLIAVQGLKIIGIN